MVDTQILIYGTHPPESKVQDPALESMRQVSRELLQSLPEIRVSAISWIEYRRRPGAARLSKPVFVEQVDLRVSDFAAHLFREARKEEIWCRHCLGAKASMACPKCGNQVAKQQRWNDIIIAATAHVVRGVDTLFTFDGGIIELAKWCTGCRIERPVSATPLFDASQNKALARKGLPPLPASVSPIALGTNEDDD